jgi:hypothetical protein
VSNKEGMFSKEGGHESREKISVSFGPNFFFCCRRPYCTDPYSLYGFGTKIKVASSMDFKADFIFLFIFLGRMEESIKLTMGIENEVWRWLYNSTILAWKMRQISVGQIWCCEVFSLAGNVVFLLFCTFLNHNNKISLSLIRFPHIGVFPGICLNF